MENKFNWSPFNNLPALLPHLITFSKLLQEWNEDDYNDDWGRNNNNNNNHNNNNNINNLHRRLPQTPRMPSTLGSGIEIPQLKPSLIPTPQNLLQSIPNLFPVGTPSSFGGVKSNITVNSDRTDRDHFTKQGHNPNYSGILFTFKIFYFSI